MAEKSYWGYFKEGMKSLVSPSTSHAASLKKKSPEPAKPADTLGDGVSAIADNIRKKKQEQQNAGN